MGAMCGPDLCTAPDRFLVYVALGTTPRSELVDRRLRAHSGNSGMLDLVRLQSGSSHSTACVLSRPDWGRTPVSDVEELKAHIETLETHVARLEGIIHVMLEQLEAGTIQETAA